MSISDHEALGSAHQDDIYNIPTGIANGDNNDDNGILMLTVNECDGKIDDGVRLALEKESTKASVNSQELAGSNVTEITTSLPKESTDTNEEMISEDSLEEYDDICSFPLGDMGIPPSDKDAVMAKKLRSLTFETASTNKIWHQFLPDIFRLSRHEVEDDDFRWHDYVKILLDFVTPRMKNSVQDLPVLHWDKVGNIMDLAFERYKYLQEIKRLGAPPKGVPAPRTIKVLVLGGSVTSGTNCGRDPAGAQHKGSEGKCRYASRFPYMLLKMLGTHRYRGVFDFKVQALGGMNSNIGIDMVEYGEGGPFDIVINTYSTNDMHIISMNEAMKKNTTLEESLLDVSQEFIRTVLDDSKRCKGHKLPLVLYYNDYMGNEQKGILEIDAYSRVMSTLTSYYGIGQLSYAHMMKHTIFGDTDEEIFSPSGWPERQIHPGRGFHTITPWLFLYYSIEMATTYCDMKSTNTLPTSHFLEHIHDQSTFTNWTSGYDHTARLPELLKNDTMPKLPRLPHHVPFGLPPILNKNLTLDNISSQWRATETSAIAFAQTECIDGNPTPPCIFSFLAGSVDSNPNPNFLKKKLNKVITQNEGWDLTWDYGKLGFEAQQHNASFAMEFDIKEHAKPVKVVNVMFMKSYGEKWEGSELRVHTTIIPSTKSTDILNNRTTSIDVLGFHGKNTSEIFSQKLILDKDEEDPGAKPNDRLRVQFDMIGGATFKITGLMICDH